MACFTAPLAGAAVAAVVQKTTEGKTRNPFLRKLHWLVKMALGGSFLLAIEHIYHGEITFFPPFLTAMKDPNDTQEIAMPELFSVEKSETMRSRSCAGVELLVSMM